MITINKNPINNMFHSLESFFNTSSCKIIREFTHITPPNIPQTLFIHLEINSSVSTPSIAHFTCPFYPIPLYESSDLQKVAVKK